MLTCLLAPAAVTCRSVSLPLGLGSREDALPRTTPALSLAGADHFQCVDTRRKGLLAVKSGRGRRTILDLGPRESMAPDTGGEVGQMIVRQFGCTRYTVEIAVPLPDAGSGDKSLVTALRNEIGVVESSILAPGDRVTLWSVADLLRLSASEPFVYGTAVEVSENESVSLRLEPKGSSARLMLVYRVGL